MARAVLGHEASAIESPCLGPKELRLGFAMGDSFFGCASSRNFDVVQSTSREQSVGLCARIMTISSCPKTRYQGISSLMGVAAVGSENLRVVGEDEGALPS